jgi:hypothetical protein
MTTHVLGMVWKTRLWWIVASVVASAWMPPADSPRGVG